ncbi:O-methyltransferase [bacterium]|nr:O-methyltransferase [bacterium]
MSLDINELHKYLETLAPKRDDVFKKLESKASEDNFPIVGPLVGQMLYMLAKISKAEKVFELGSGFGYSALWFLQGLPENGLITLSDFDQSNLDQAKVNLESIPENTGRFILKQGDALKLLEAEKQSQDIIFNDIDKEAYPKVIALAAQKLRRGGLLISDNTIWHGKVLDQNPDSTTQSVLEHNKLLAESQNFQTIWIPLRDGVSVSIKM